ncbi:hypothetical protein LCGC14_0017390 [marine sediment metagenome]|uniref:ABC transmembrane type-1 domain-containing protein n=1 Tax=marine sediment metagenome TaxID=412755 RepID=A0A0F9W1V9_9ZZZZ
MTDPQPTTAAPPGPQPVRPPPKDSWVKVVGKLVVVLAVMAVLGWAYGGAEIDPGELLRNRENIADFAKEFAVPNFSDWRDYVREMIVTVQMAIWGTFLAMVLAVPLGLLSSANLAPWYIRWPVRRLMDAFRAINEMVFALVFIAAVGLGPFAGMLALFVHTLGTLAKLFSEAVEAIDPHPVEGIRATGASGIDEVVYGVIPQVMPLWISYTLYRFESNVRSASVVGMVGAGGIGYLLHDAMGSYDYGDASAMLLIILATVVLLDVVSTRVRKRFI